MFLQFKEFNNFQYQVDYKPAGVPPVAATRKNAWKILSKLLECSRFSLRRKYKQSLSQ